MMTQARPATTPSFLPRLKGAALRFESGLTAYDLFAATIVSLLLSRAFRAFNLWEGVYGWSQVPANILLPVFLFGVGYNVGRRIDPAIALGAVLIMFWRWAAFPDIPVLPMNILVMIIVTRLALEPLMAFALKSRARFWLVNLALAALALPTHAHFSEHGTLVTLIAMAGWLCRNEDEVPPGIVNVKEYMFALYLLYLALNQALSDFSPLQFAAMAAGAAYVFRLLYRLRALILNSLKRRPRDAVEKLCSVLGHKTMEIYVLQALFLMTVLYFAQAAGAL